MLNSSNHGNGGDAVGVNYKNIEEVDAVDEFTDEQQTEEETSPVLYN